MSNNNYIANPGSYRQVLQDFIQPYQNMVSFLERRLSLLDKDINLKNEYELNEIEIAKIKTRAEINCRRKIIKEREGYNEKFMREFISDVSDVRKNWDTVVAQAKAGIKTNKDLEKTVPYIRWTEIEKDIEAKISVFKMLKKHLGNGTKSILAK